jgi:alkylation response protein AidB-like acyl-CoA dehydrogenase
MRAMSALLRTSAPRGRIIPEETPMDAPDFETLLPRPLSPRRARLLARARTHAADFETRADDHDRAGSYPLENMEAMKASGYAHMILPEAWGGEDVSLLELCACQEQLGQGCAGTAIAINMHLFSLGALLLDARAAPEPGRARMEAGLRLIGRRKQIVAGSFSEHGQAGAYFLPATRARRVPGGWEVHGRKAYTSNWPAADLVSGLVRLEGHPDGDDRVAMVTAPKGTPGLSSPGASSWDVLGLRASGSYDVVWDGVFVADLLMPETQPAADYFTSMRAFGGWFTLSVASVYLGVAQAAIDWTVDFLRERRAAAGGRPLSRMPGLQYQLGEMVALQAASRSLIRTSAESWEASPWTAEEARRHGNACAYVTSNHHVRVLDLAMDVAGGPGLFRAAGLERRYRDVRGAKAHPPSDMAALEEIAKARLGISWGESPRWG